MDYKITKVVAGGESGAEIGALVGAERARIKIGGAATSDFYTETGPQPFILRDRFKLAPSPSPCPVARTKNNIQYSDATIIFTTDPEDEYIQKVVEQCNKLDKIYCMVNVTKGNHAELVNNFLSITKPSIINVTGDKKSTTPSMAHLTAKIISALNH